MTEDSTTTFKKKFLSIHFDCCQVYYRLYINNDGSAYVGRCPRCLRPAQALVGKEGTNQRIFRAE